MTTPTETVSKKTARETSDDLGPEKHTKKRTKINNEPTSGIPAAGVMSCSLFLYVVSFVDDTNKNPGAVVLAKSESHARSLIQLNAETKKHKISEINLVSMFTPSATIVGRSPTREQKTEESSRDTIPLRVFFTAEHDMPSESIKGGAVVVSESIAKATEILDEELKLHDVRSSKYKKYEFVEIERDVAIVIAV